MYSQQKFLLFALLVLRYPIDRDSQQFNKLEAYIRNDYLICPQCFEYQSSADCEQVKHNYEFDEDFTKTINILFGVRHIRSLKEIKNSSHRMLAKYIAKDIDLDFISHLPADAEVAYNILYRRFFNESRLDGMQFCHPSQVERFVDLFAKNYSKMSVWIHMNVDIQPILLPYLHSQGFPVPKTFYSCGFTTFQSDDGIPLSNFFTSSLDVKFRIAKQLLEAALQFTVGFDGFRIYITDLIPENIVYNPKEDRVSFVDLDTAFIVDGTIYNGSFYKHKFIECNGCFAFSPIELCSNSQSDINLFAVCQLLREDLMEDRSKGFLSAVAQEHIYLMRLLDMCMDCPDETCQTRIDVVNRIIENIQGIIDKSLRR